MVFGFQRWGNRFSCYRSNCAHWDCGKATTVVCGRHSTHLGKFGCWGRGESHIRQEVGRVWRRAQLSPLDREVEDPQINADGSQLSGQAFAGSDRVCLPFLSLMAWPVPYHPSCPLCVYFWVTAPLRNLDGFHSAAIPRGGISWDFLGQCIPYFYAKVFLFGRWMYAYGTISKIWKMYLWVFCILLSNIYLFWYLLVFGSW